MTGTGARDPSAVDADKEERASVSSMRVAVDVGGTFTDVFVLDEQSAAVRVAKVPSTPHDPMEGVMAGVAAAEVDLADVTLFSHGTTVATNALITRRFPPAAMVTTRGFRDVLEIRRGTRDDLWDAYKDVSPPYIRRRDRFEVSERVDVAGEVVAALDEEEARALAVRLRRRGVETVAVCFINAYANPVNELRMREILEEELPGVSVSTSSQTLPEIFEYERFSTTVANAVLSPLVTGYVSRLEQRLKDGGYTGDLLLLHSGGGVMTGAMVQRYAGRIAASGIAAGAIACRQIAALCGFENAIGLDMGGTSTDISLVYGGDIRTTNEWAVEYGHPICFPSIEILTIGAGGGSLAWIDPAGSLRNGPQSAGADPGPAAYGRGGEEPTNTDANIVLGRLGGELVGGAVTLDAAAAERAVQRIAEPLGLETTDAARAIIRVADANMADAVRLTSIRRGYDPREFALVVFGGAGALHGASLAKELSIPTVIVPPNPGITSALGCLLVDVRHDLSEMYLRRIDEAQEPEIEAEFAKLEAEGRERLAAEGVAEDRMTFQRTIAMRYLGQWRSLAVDVAPGPVSLEAVVAHFHAEHEREFAYRREGAAIEIYQLALQAVGVTPKPELARHPVQDGAALPAPAATRDVHFDEVDGAVQTPVYDRSALPAGARVEGPAIIQQLDSTIVVPPDVVAEVDEHLIIRMKITEAGA
jgi:N-methylhydantoinase A